MKTPSFSRIWVASLLLLLACSGDKPSSPNPSENLGGQAGTSGGSGGQAGGTAGGKGGADLGGAGGSGQSGAGAGGTTGGAGQGGESGGAEQGGSAGSLAGSGGSTTAGAGGSTTAGTGGSTTAGTGGSTTAGTGGSTTAGTGGSTTAGAGGSTTAGTGGSTTAGAGGNPQGGAGQGGMGASTIFDSPQKPHTFTYRIAKPYSIGEDSTYDVVGLDLFENSEDVIASLKSKGKATVCYFSSTYEDWRPDFSSLSGAEKTALNALLAGPLDGWPGEQWVDLVGFSATSPSASHQLLRSIMDKRILQAKGKGCDAVDFDNVNEHENNVKNKDGKAISSLDQYAYNAWLAGQAHAAGLKAFLKNDLSQIADNSTFPGGKGLAQIFDGAINEQCFEYDECDEMIPFRDLQKPIFVIQYKYGKTFPTTVHKNLATTLHLNVSFYQKSPEEALKFDPTETFGAW